MTFLLSQPGINVNQPDVDGGTPLFAASGQGSLDVTTALLSHPNIDVNQ